jgi:hypothetical protein
MARSETGTGFAILWGKARKWQRTTIMQTQLAPKNTALNTAPKGLTGALKRRSKRDAANEHLARRRSRFEAEYRAVCSSNFGKRSSFGLRQERIVSSS